MRNKKPKFYYVYVITNLINNKQYVGSKICYEDDPENDNYFGSSKFLKKDIKDLGKENFEKKIIQQDYKNHQDLLDGESFYILKYNTLAPNGYNRFLPNERKSFNTVGISIKEIWETNYGKEEADKRYEEWKNKINNSGENNPMFGKHHSEESILKNIANQPYLGKPLPDWLKKKISEGTKGKNNPFYSKTHSKETINGIRQKQLGKRWITNLELQQNKFTKGKELENCLQNGWTHGRKKFKV